MLLTDEFSVFEPSCLCVLAAGEASVADRSVSEHHLLGGVHHRWDGKVRHIIRPIRTVIVSQGGVRCFHHLKAVVIFITIRIHISDSIFNTWTLTVITKDKISNIDQNHFLYQTVNILILL